MLPATATHEMAHQEVLPGGWTITLPIWPV